MTHPLYLSIEAAIQKAMSKGAFDGLPGTGKPLKKCETGTDAVLNRILVESKAKPPVVILKQKIQVSRLKLQTLTDAEDRKSEMRVLADLEMRLAMELEAHRKYG